MKTKKISIKQMDKIAEKIAKDAEPAKKDWRDKLTDLIEKEIYLATGSKSKKHFSGNCLVNDIVHLVEKEIEKAWKGEGLVKKDK